MRLQTEVQSQIVTVEILSLLQFGLAVKLPNGTTGLVREREIAWDHSGRRRWRSRFRVGERVQAIVLGPGLDQRLELSLRLAESDPWEKIDTRYSLGAVVTGTITGVQSYGVFVELEPGVTGLLHISRFPVWAQNLDPNELFWPNDTVRVAIEKIDPTKRQIGLSLTHALFQRWHGLGIPAPAAALAAASQHTTRAEDEQLQPEYIPDWRVLIVEDDPAQLEALARWLRRAGLVTFTAHTAEEGLELAAREAPDLVLTDYGLPQMDGLQLLHALLDRTPALHCALMTDWARANEHADEIERARARGAELLIKPLRPEDVLELLSENTVVPYNTAGTLVRAGVQIDAPGLKEANGSGRQRLHDLLARLCADTGAAKVVIFALDPAQRIVSVVGEHGPALLNPSATTDLIHSPVRDVAEDQPVMRIDDIQYAESRVRYLKPLLPFRSLLGLRVPAALDERYTLFLFGQRPAMFQGAHETLARTTATAMGAMIEHEHLLTSALELQRLALLGQLSRALVHEINHQLSPINFVISDIKHDLGELDRAAAGGEGAALRDIRYALNHLDQSVQNLTTTARMFGHITVQSREQSTDLASVVTDVVHLVHDMADRAHVRLSHTFEPSLAPLTTNPVQLQQMLLNVVINAIQHIVALRPASGGMVVLRVDRRVMDERPVVRIVVEDDGPGIHRQLWERVFELGFTTRTEGGSGLGLYLTRSLAEAQGGRAYIAESHRLWGTTLVIELPAQL
jgi:signal transduction histidine kinase/predicted RNA-binding protein with RPS1 domain/ActR/RegA family two-component response regulator